MYTTSNQNSLGIEFIKCSPQNLQYLYLKPDYTNIKRNHIFPRRNIFLIAKRRCFSVEECKKINIKVSTYFIFIL